MSSVSGEALVPAALVTSQRYCPVSLGNKLRMVRSGVSSVPPLYFPLPMETGLAVLFSTLSQRRPEAGGLADIPHLRVTGPKGLPSKVAGRLGMLVGATATSRKADVSILRVSIHKSFCP